jgi:Rab3 GTPase-activating protein catalytic subunit
LISSSISSGGAGIKRSNSNPDDNNTIQSIQSNNKIVKVATNINILETNSSNSEIEYDEFISLINENTTKVETMSNNDDVVGHCKNDHNYNADGVDKTEKLIQLLPRDVFGRVIISADPNQRELYNVSANTSKGAAMKNNDKEEDVKSRNEKQQVISDEILVGPDSTVLLDHTNTHLSSPQKILLISENEITHPASSVTGEELMGQFSSAIGPSPSKMIHTPSKLPNMDTSIDEDDDEIAYDNDNSIPNASRPHWCNLAEIPVVHIAGTPPDPLSSLKKQIRDRKLKAIASSEMSIQSEGSENMNENISSIVDMQHSPIPSLLQNESNTSSTQAATTVSGMDCVSQYSSMKSPSPMKMDHFAFDVSMDTSIDINDSVLDDKNDATYLDDVDPCDDDDIVTNGNKFAEHHSGSNVLFDDDDDDGSICRKMRVSRPRRSPRQSNDVVVKANHIKFKHPSTTKISRVRIKNNNDHDLQNEYNVDHSCSTPLERLTRDIGNTLRQWRVHQGCDWHVSLDWADKMDGETSDIEEELSDDDGDDDGKDIDAQHSINRDMSNKSRPIQFMSMDMCERGFANRTRAIKSLMGDTKANNMQPKTPQAPSPPSPPPPKKKKRPRVPHTIITPMKELPAMCSATKIKRGDYLGAQCIRSQKIIFHTVGYTSEQIDDSVTLNRRRYTIPLLLKLWDAPHLPLDASRNEDGGTVNAVPRSLRSGMYSSSFALTGEYGVLSPCGTGRMYYNSSTADASNDSSVEPAAGLMRNMSTLFNIGQHITLCLDLSEVKTDTNNNDIESLYNDLRYCIERNISEALEYQERKSREERRHRHHTRLESATQSHPDRHHLIGKNLNDDDDASTVGDGSEYSESEDSDSDYPPKYDFSIDQNEIHAEVTASLTTLLQTAMNLAASENKCCIPVFGIWGTYNGVLVNTDSREKRKDKGLQQNLLQIRESCNIRQVENDEGSSTNLLLSSPAISGMCLSGTFQSTHRLYYIPEQVLPLHLTTLNGLAKVLLTQCPSFDGAVVLAAARHLYYWEQRDVNVGHDVSPMRHRNQNWRTFSSLSVGDTSPVEMYREQCQQQAYQILERACSPKIHRPEPLWGPSKGNPLVSLSATATWGTIPSQDGTSVQPPPLLQLPLKIRSSNFVSTPSDLLDLEYSLQSAALNPIGMGVVEKERGHYEFGSREPIFLASAAFDANAPCATLSANTRCVLAALLRCGSLGLDTLPGHLTKTKIVAKFSTPSKIQMAGESTGGEDSSNTDYILRKALDAAKVGPVTKRLIDALDWGEVDMKLSAADFDRATNEVLRRIQSTSYPAPPEEVFWNSKLQVQSHEHQSQSKGSPPGRLLSILFAHMSRMRTPPSMCRMWLLFVEELRTRWDENESLPNLGFVPGLDCVGNVGKGQWGLKRGTPVLGHRAKLAAFINSSEPDPDRDHCIINQMLQVYNICIECKISIDALYNKQNNTGVNDSILSNSTVNSTATENRSSEDDDFFDPEEEEVAFDGSPDGKEKKQDIERMLKEAAITTTSHNRIGARCPVPDAMPLIKSGDQVSCSRMVVLYCVIISVLTPCFHVSSMPHICNGPCP